MRCPECFVEEGQLHVEGCLQEQCGACGSQREYCDCISKGRRVPWLYFPRICARCGKINPRIFIVSDEEWQKYVPPSVSKKHLCRKCYNEIKKLQEKRVH